MRNLEIFRVNLYRRKLPSITLLFFISCLISRVLLLSLLLLLFALALSTLSVAVSVAVFFHQFLSCRPRDIGGPEAIEQHIVAASSRNEPMEIVPQSFLPPFPRFSHESRQEKVSEAETRQYARYRSAYGHTTTYDHA